MNLDSFIKKITFQEITADGIRLLGDDPDNGGQRAAGCAQECSNNQIEHIMKDLKDLVRPNVWNMETLLVCQR